MRHENRKHDIAIGKEAKDFSNISVVMRPSFFDFVKANFVQDLQKSSDILKVANIEGIKVATEDHGEAFVEYSVEITFEANKGCHTIKLTAYTTNSHVMIQPMHEKSGLKENLGNLSSPRYFVEQFLLPWSNECISNNRFDEATRSVYLNLLKEEIKKLDLTKLDQKKTTRVSV